MPLYNKYENSYRNFRFKHLNCDVKLEYLNCDVDIKDIQFELKCVAVDAADMPVSNDLKYKFYFLCTFNY